MITTLSEEAQNFLAALKEYAPTVGGPAAGALLGYFAAKRKQDAEADKIESEGDVLRMDAVTRNFQTLIAGYEKRVADLTQEVNDMREEMRTLRKDMGHSKPVMVSRHAIQGY